MSIVTKTGDDGTTGLFGGSRVDKDDARLHAYGTVDELNALLGVIAAEPHLPEGMLGGLTRLQHLLFTLGADLATPIDAPVTTHRVTPDHLAAIEEWIVQWEEHLPAMQSFILPGGTRAAALLHQARTVCRRAERWLVTLKRHTAVNETTLQLLNRLSDLLFLLARAVNRDAGQDDIRVEYE